MFQQIRQQRVDKKKEDHQQAIEEKDAAIALLSDYLQNRQYENVALQAQKNVHQAQLQRCQDQLFDLIINRYVPCAQLQRCQDQLHDLIINCYVPCTNDLGKNNIVMTIEKKYHS